VDHLLEDARYAIRILGRRPAHAAVAVVTMTVGIGATTVLFSIVWGVLFRPLPWPDADRLVLVQESRGREISGLGQILSGPSYNALKEQGNTIAEIGAWNERTVTLTGVDDSHRLQIADITASMLSLAGAQPLLGRAFTAADEPGIDERVALISYGLWRQRFGGAEDVLGETVRFNEQSHTIIGVMPPAFAFPNRRTAAWLPLDVAPMDGTVPMLKVMARLERGVTPEQVATEATARARAAAPDLRLMAIFGSRDPPDIRVVPVLDTLTQEVRPALLLLLVAVGLLLVAAIGNVASVQLVRASTRHREMAIRAAVGATAGRLTRQLLIENVAVGLVGGAAGLLFALGLHRSLPALLPPDFPRAEHIVLDWRVAVFAVGISIAAGALFGLGPSLHVRRLDLRESLAEDRAPGGTLRSRRSRARNVIMAGQVALAAILLVGASLLVQNFITLLTADRGFESANVLTAEVVLPRWYTPERRVAFIEAVLERLRSMPGVTHAASSTVLPLDSDDIGLLTTAKSRGDEQGQLVADTLYRASLRVVSPTYFSALGIRLVEGRDLTARDTKTSLPVVVVNQAYARRYLRESPLNETIRLEVGGRSEWHVVGIVEDIRWGLDATEIKPEAFFSYQQYTGGAGSGDPKLVVRTQRHPAAVQVGIRTAARELDPALAIESVVTLEQRLMSLLAAPRLYATTLGAFAACTLVIVTVGLFGVLSYGVAQRSHEIGIRTALGAPRSAIVKLVAAHAAAITVPGLAIGLGAAAALIRWAGIAVPGIIVWDTGAFLLGATILAVAALAACLAPAWRATRPELTRVLLAQ
jgi:putative ABC transport system permease protein